MNEEVHKKGREVKGIDHHHHFYLRHRIILYQIIEASTKLKIQKCSCVSKI
jgi:hypothetical protein